MADPETLLHYLAWQVRLMTILIVVTVAGGVVAGGCYLQAAEMDLRNAQQALYRERYAVPLRAREALESEARVLDRRRDALLRREVDVLKQEVTAMRKRH